MMVAPVERVGTDQSSDFWVGYLASIVWHLLNPVDEDERRRVEEAAVEALETLGMAR